MVRGCVATSSQKQYFVGWKHWLNFHHLYDLDYRWDFQPHRTQTSDTPSPVDRSLAFIAYAFHVLRLQASTIGNYLAGISYHIRCNGGSSAFLNSPLVNMARSGITLLSRKQKAQCERGALPFTWGMIDRYRSRYGTFSARYHCTFTALALAFTLLLRVSEYIKSSSDHYLRASDVLFETAVGGMLSSCDWEALSSATVTGVVFIVRSAKNDQLGETHRLCFPRKMPSDSSSCICSIALSWALRARLLPSAPFLSYRNTWCLSRWDIDSAVKTIAKLYGLNTTRFTPHSLRYGGASALAAGGVSDAIIQVTGRWKSLAFLQYLKLSSQMMSRSLDILTNVSTFTVHDVRRLTNAIS